MEILQNSARCATRESAATTTAPLFYMQLLPTQQQQQQQAGAVPVGVTRINSSTSAGISNHNHVN
jgi:hypothetical protein